MVRVEADKKSKALYSAAVPDRPSNRDLEFGPGVGITDNWELCSPGGPPTVAGACTKGTPLLKLAPPTWLPPAMPYRPTP